MSGSSWKKEFRAYAEKQDAASAQRIKETILKTEENGGASGHRPPKSRIGLIAAALTLLVTGTVFAAAVLSHPGLDTDRYLNTLPEQREEIPEINGAIEGTDARIESCRVELVGEYTGGYNQYEESYNTDIPARRLENGFPAWDPEEWAFLRGLTPEKSEVYYDGSRLYLNVCMRTPYAPYFLMPLWNSGDGPEKHLEMTLFDCTAEVEGKDQTDILHRSGWGTGAMMRPSEGKTEEEWKTTEELWVSADFDALDTPLDDGVCRMTLQYYIYDASVDDMSSVGNVARVICTVVFDTSEGNRNSETVSVNGFKGDVILTVFEYDEEKGRHSIGNRTVSLDGLVLEAKTRYTAGGMVVTLTAASLPEGWNGEMLDSFFRGFGSGVRFGLYVNGEYVREPLPLSSYTGEVRMELPILKSDLSQITDIRLIPQLPYLTSVEVCTDPDRQDDDLEETVFEKRELPPDAEPLCGWFTATSEEMITQPLPGCEIVIPLPEKMIG